MAPVAAVNRTSDGQGYWVASSNGTVFNFDNALGTDPMGPVDFMNAPQVPSARATIWPFGLPSPWRVSSTKSQPMYSWAKCSLSLQAQHGWRWSKPLSFTFAATSGQAHASVTVQRGPATPVTASFESVAATGFYGVFWQPPASQDNSPSCSKRSPSSPRPPRYAPYGTTTVLLTWPRPGPVMTTLPVDAASNYATGSLPATPSAPLTTATTSSPTTVASCSPSWASSPTTSKQPDEFSPVPALTGPPAARTWPEHSRLSSPVDSSPSDGCRVPETEPRGWHPITKGASMSGCPQPVVSRPIERSLTGQPDPSTTVPDPLKAVLASVEAEAPGVNGVYDQMRLAPWIPSEDAPDRLFRTGLDGEHDSDLIERPTQNDDTSVHELVHVVGVLTPVRLLVHRLFQVPLGAGMP